MEKLHYVAILERAGDGGFGVFFPDLPGCVSGGDNELDALANAESALNLHVAGMIEDGESLPAPTPPSAIEQDPDVSEAARVLLGVAADPPKVRINVVMDANVLQAIDLVTDNRSQFLTVAAKAALRAQAARSAPARVATVSKASRERKARIRAYRAG